MSNKKEEILETALLLFNEKGVDKVTTRDIAKHLQISLGNLTYYFPIKKDIVFALTEGLIKAVKEVWINDSLEKNSNSLIQYFNKVENIFTAHYKFKFIFQDCYSGIISAFPEVQKMFQDFTRFRFDAWSELNKNLISENLAKQELVDDSLTHSHMLNILGQFWHQEFYIYYPELTEKQKIKKALTIFFQSYKPYLTQNGLDVLNPLLTK